MASSGSSRREARERALSLLYEAEAKSESPAAVIAALPAPPDAFAAEIVHGVGEHLEEVDALITRFASGGWTLERMPAIDRLLLRMSGFELLYRRDVPAAVTISEAVGLAKRFSTDESGRYINGVLAAMAGETRPGERRPRAPANEPGPEQIEH